MRAVLFAFTARGRDTAARLRDCLILDGWTAETRVPEKLRAPEALPYNGALADFTGGVFDRDALIFVGACGIAVRAIAPHVASKRSDPAVLCVDERGQFVISLLSGHIGGANRLTREVAAALGAVPVITTATDVNGRFSVDAWAEEHGCAISSMALAKRVSAEILTRDIPFCADRADAGQALPDGLVWHETGELGICVSAYDRHPYENTLLLVPKVLRIGLGCRRGTPAEAIEAAVQAVLDRHRLREEAVAGVASIDVKADEAGLLAFCQARRWPARFYSADELSTVPGCFSKSEFVQKTVGVDNVCERAAAASGGALIVPKTALNGVTVAVAEEKWRVNFGEDSRGGHRPG